MQELLRWLASWRGLEIEADNELRLELSAFPAGGAGLLTVLGIALALALVWLAYRRDGAKLSPSRRAVLAALRAIAVLLACALLLEPNLVAIKRELRPGHTIVLVDRSQSMGHRDPYRGESAAATAEAWRALGVERLAEVPRIALAERLLTAADHAALRGLAGRNRVTVYGFDSGLDELAVLPLAGTGDDDPAGVNIDLGGLDAEGRHTNIGDAVRRALENSRDSAIAGVVLLTDGRRNLGPPGAEVARYLGSRKVPATIVVPIGDPSATTTLRLTRLDAPERVFQRDPFTVRASVESQGYDDVAFAAHLRRRTASAGDAVTLRSQQVRLGRSAPSAEIVFDDLHAAEPGTFTYSVEIDPPSFEAPSPERHVKRQQIEVLGEHTRVLVVAGGPSFEFRTLRQLLIRDKTIEAACWLLSADPDFPQDGNVSLESLPEERAELGEFDVFVLLDPNAARLSEAFCENLATQVVENGAGLWWICGEKYSLDALRPGAVTAPIADLLPIVPDLERADVEYGLGHGMPTARRYHLTPDGETHKATRLVDDADQARDLWSALPGFHFAFPVDRAKPGAQVLVDFASRTEFGSRDVPLIASQFLGSGRVLFAAGDDVYRWRAAFEEAYDRFWIKGIRYLFEARLNAGDARLRIVLDTEKVELGQPIHIRVEARDEELRPLVAAGYRLNLVREDGAAEVIALEPIEAVPGQFEVRLRPSAIGYWRIEPEAGVESPVRAAFQVVPAAIETEGPAGLAELGAIAGVDGGVLVANPAQFGAELGKIPSMTAIDTFRTNHSVWDAWPTVLAIVGVLALEWWLRKRANLL